jgi:hypothetical protein
LHDHIDRDFKIKALEVGSNFPVQRANHMAEYAEWLYSNNEPIEEAVTALQV